MAYNYLNKVGLTNLWANIKAYVTSRVPTKVSELTNDSGYITGVSWNNVSGKPSTFTPKTHTHAKSQITDFPTLATVATSGSYTDLANKPTIPTVNNATLTIQKNGTNVKTFTANSSSNVTADITVPTKVSELTNDSGYITGVSWNNVSGKPSTFTPKTHTHDDRYYTESEINTKLGIKANDANVVHLTGDESITNKKYFDSPNNSISLVKRITDYATEDTPTRNVYQHLAFQDKNNKNLALVQYASRSSNVRDLDLYVFDASGSGYGIKIGTN